jgi:hypothetical protein
VAAVNASSQRKKTPAQKMAESKHVAAKVNNAAPATSAMRASSAGVAVSAAAVASAAVAAAMNVSLRWKKARATPTAVAPRPSTELDRTQPFGRVRVQHA